MNALGKGGGWRREGGEVEAWKWHDMSPTIETGSEKRDGGKVRKALAVMGGGVTM
jgi:hypothetical protein